MNRNIGIDLGRWLFAFLIVTLHMGMAYGDIIHPIARCGVPFFYMVTGYYLGDSEPRKFRKSALRWLKLWGGYIILIPLFIYLIDFTIPTINLNTLWTLITIGVPNSLSERTVEIWNADILVPLWFLYGGSIALFIISFAKKAKWLWLLSFVYPIAAHIFHIQLPELKNLLF